MSIVNRTSERGQVTDDVEYRKVDLDAVQQTALAERLSVFSTAGRIRSAIKARAGTAPTARFRPGELARIARCDEDEVHEVIEAMIKAFELGAESHPQFMIVLGNIPEYQPPPPPTPPVPDGWTIKTVPNRRGSFTSKLVPIEDPK